MNVVQLLWTDRYDSPVGLLGQAFQRDRQVLPRRVPVQVDHLDYDVRHLGQHVGMQIEDARMHQVRHQLLAVLLQYLEHQRLALLVVRVRHADQIVEELHDGGVGLPMDQRARHQGALDDVRQGGTLQEGHRRPLDEPRAQPEKVVDGVGVIEQAVLLLEHVERGLDEGLQHLDEAGYAVDVIGVLVDLEKVLHIEEFRSKLPTGSLMFYNTQANIYKTVAFPCKHFHNMLECLKMQIRRIFTKHISFIRL